MRRKSTRSKGRFFAVLAVAGLIGAATYAFTATNTVAASRAGDGAAGISGYDVTNVSYTLGADPSLITAYSFDLDAPASTVHAKIVSGQLTYDTCTETNPLTNTWTCTAPLATTVASADNLRVIAVE